MQKLIDAAKAIAKEVKLNKNSSVGGVAAALEAENGAIYTGVCIETACGIGFCAEHAAIAELAKTKKLRIKRIVAVNDKGRILPPCGRCRELIYLMDRRNLATKVILSKSRTVPLSKLLPLPWVESK